MTGALSAASVGKNTPTTSSLRKGTRHMDKTALEEFLRNEIGFAKVKVSGIVATKKGK
jgi:hypothetical protein